MCIILCCVHVDKVRVLCRRVPGAECGWEGTTGEPTYAELAMCVCVVSHVSCRAAGFWVRGETLGI